MSKSAFTGTYRKFTRMLAAARADAGLTQVELAERIGWQQTGISKVERGERRLDVVEFLLCTKGIGIDASQFIAELQAK